MCQTGRPGPAVQVFATARWLGDTLAASATGAGRRESRVVLRASPARSALDRDPSKGVIGRAMRLMDLVAADRIAPALHARDKREALAALGGLLAKGVPSVRADEITRVLEEREALASTGVGDEVAIPHGRISGLDRVIAALAFSPEGIEFDAIDRKPVRIFVAILAPEKSATEHLRALARFSRLLRDSRTRDRLLSERDPAAVLAILEAESTATGC
jgi:PTS system nitrogen regulatory IIA component